MKLLTQELIEKIPELYSTEEEQDPMVVAKFFDPYSQWTWYVIEGQKQEDEDWLFFGYVVGLEAELGYFTLGQLQSVKLGNRPRIERDLYFTPCRLSKLRKQHNCEC